MSCSYSAESCDSHKTCDDCHTDPECGWCRDPADTGLGTCSQGGFVSPLPSSSSSSSCPNSHWFFDQCPGKLSTSWAFQLYLCTHFLPLLSLPLYPLSLAFLLLPFSPLIFLSSPLPPFLACQCNGHSTCVNGSVCEECQNNTQGDTCEQCADGYYGDATGGGICTGETTPPFTGPPALFVWSLQIGHLSSIGHLYISIKDNFYGLGCVPQKVETTQVM